MAESPSPNAKPKQSISILVAGKTGAGKSTLINSVVGKEICKEGAGPNRITDILEPHTIVVDGVEVKVWDSPGLSDGLQDNHTYVQQLREKLSEIDLLIYCIRMDEHFDDDDEKAMVSCLELNEPSKVWDHSVIALTFANQITCPASSDSEDEDAIENEEAKYFEEIIEMWIEGLKRPLKKHRVENVPIAPTGYSRSRKLHKNCIDWMSEFWTTCLRRIKENGKKPLVQVNKHRLHSTRDFEDDPDAPLWKHSLFYQEGMVLYSGASGHNLGRSIFSDVI